MFASNMDCNRNTWPGNPLQMEGEIMRLHVALYGGARVVSGKSAVELAFETPSVTLTQVLEKLIATYPRVRPIC